MRTPQTLLALLFLAFCTINPAQAQMTVHHINMGQADATLIELKTAAILIDAGGSSIKDQQRDRKHLLKYLDDFFAARPLLNNTIYSFIITHPHIDHTKLMMNVMKRYRVKNLIDNGDDGGSGIAPLKSARQYIRDYNASHQRQIIYNKIDSADIGAEGYSTWWLRKLRDTEPDVDVRFLNASRNCKSGNNDSLVTLITYRGAKYLITGDAEWDDKYETCTPAIPRMLSRFQHSSLLDVDVYKVGHHGSHNGTNIEFLRAMSPKVSILSAGHYQDRDPNDKYDAWVYGHPREKTVAELEEFTSLPRPTPPPPFRFYTMRGQRDLIDNRPITKAIYCTCWDGDIKVTILDAATPPDVQRMVSQP